jgi:hypothetical protein
MSVAAPYTAQRTASIIAFISDPALLGGSFAGPTRDRRRAVLRAAFALPMSSRDLDLFAEVAGGRTPPQHRVKELACAIGRGGGKDSGAAALATYIAVTSDFSRLRPGERATIMTLATDRQQAAIPSATSHRQWLALVDRCRRFEQAGAALLFEPIALALDGDHG